VAQQVNNHQIFSAIFLAGKKRRYGSLRLMGVSRRGSLDRTGKNLVARDPEKSLGRITQDRALRRLDEGAERRAAASQAVVDHFRRFIAELGPKRNREVGLVNIARRDEGADFFHGAVIPFEINGGTSAY